MALDFEVKSRSNVKNHPKSCFLEFLKIYEKTVE